MHGEGHVLPRRRSSARVPTASIIPVNMQITLLMTGATDAPVNIEKIRLFSQ